MWFTVWCGLCINFSHIVLKIAGVAYTAEHLTFVSYGLENCTVDWLFVALCLTMQITDTAAFARAVRKATRFLEQQLDSVSSDPYALNIITYALTLARSSLASDALTKLNALAITEGLYIISHHQFLFIQQNSTNTVTNVGTNEVETGMTRLIALTVTPVY